MQVMQALGRFRISPMSISSVSLLYILLSYIYDWTHHHLDLDCVSALNFQFGVRKMNPHPAVALRKKTIPSPTQKQHAPVSTSKMNSLRNKPMALAEKTNPPRNEHYVKSDSDSMCRLRNSVLFCFGYSTIFHTRGMGPDSSSKQHLGTHGNPPPLHLCLAETPRPRDFAASPNNPTAVPGVDVAIVALPCGLRWWFGWLDNADFTRPGNL